MKLHGRVLLLCLCALAAALSLGGCASRPMPLDHGLFGAIDADDVARVQQALSAEPRLATARFSFLTDRDTLLHVAAGRCSTQTTRLLLQNGAAPNACDGDGRTPLFVLVVTSPAKHNNAPKDAIAHDKLAIAELLLEHGADPNIADQSGSTPLQQVQAPGRGLETVADLMLHHGAKLPADAPQVKDFEPYPLLPPVLSGNVEQVRHALAGAPGTGKRQQTLNYALMIAATAVSSEGWAKVPRKADANADLDRNLTNAPREEQLVEIARLLLSAGADASAKVPGFHAPILPTAVGSRSAGFLELLLSNGADPNARDRAGQTALHQAVMGGDAGVVELLLRHGAKATVKDRNGATPLDMAALLGYREIVDMLRRGRKGIEAPRSSGP